LCAQISCIHRGWWNKTRYEIYAQDDTLKSYAWLLSLDVRFINNLKRNIENFSTVELWFMNASHHEQIGSRTNFLEKRKKRERVLRDEQCLE
jgi:hypothetical protein